MSVRAAIDNATRLLPGVPVESGPDPRWQLIIEVSEYVASNPVEVWNFAAKWGCSEEEDVRMAIATCVLEHLLEHHFAHIFPLAATLARSNPQFARTVSSCWLFGDAEEPANALALNGLIAELRNDA